MEIARYDLIVIGSGPAGEKAAVKAAYFNYKVALIENSRHFGGTAAEEAIPAKVLKEMALRLSGKFDQKVYGEFNNKKILVENFLERARILSQHQSVTVKENLENHKVDLYKGTASFVDPHTIQINGEEDVTIYGENIVISTGSSPMYFGDTLIINEKERLTAPNHLIVDGKRIHNTKTLLEANRFPKSLCIVGMGVSGCEYASAFSAMGTKVTIINRSDNILSFMDTDIVQFFLEELRKDGVSINFFEEIESIEIPNNDEELLTVMLKTGKKLSVDMVLYAGGRTGNTPQLKIENAGLRVNEKGAIPIDEHYRTSVPHIYAAGDVNGKALLANLAMDQGRIAVAKMFQMKDINELGKCSPLGIYSIPEMASVGLTEEQVKKNGINYCVGVCNYSDVPKGALVEGNGMIKLVFERESKVVLGVHVIGALATELVHYGIDLVKSRKSLMDLITEAFNFPTLHEVYKYAAYDGLSNLTGHKLKKSAFKK
ncbi:MAG: FAD-dependent oxidoreductase [Parachlamydiaceae bacterium]|nr:FAD-dependent oxidoreductase [Parachlamydiaceae bacterium]